MSNEITVSGITSSLLPDLESNGVGDLLPKGITIDTFAKLAAVAIFNNPMLHKADPKSVINSLILSAKDGLLCDNREAALVPFNSKGKTLAQYMPMVDGVLKRVRQSGQVSIIASKPVFANDDFTFFTDEDGDHFKHVPTLGEPGELVAVIAYAKMKDGTRHVELLRRWEIDRSRAASKTGQSEYGPWHKYYDRMACKTGLHRIGRRLPNSSEMLEMLERGDVMSWQQEERDVTPKSKQSTTLDSLLAEPEREKVTHKDLELLVCRAGDVVQMNQAKADIKAAYEFEDITLDECNALLALYKSNLARVKKEEIDAAEFESTLVDDEQIEF